MVGLCIRDYGLYGNCAFYHLVEMKTVITILFTVGLSCSNSIKTKANYCFILQDFNGVNYVFLLKDNKLCYNQNFFKKLSPGFIIMNSQISFDDYDSATLIKIPNTKRNKLVYIGRVNKYYVGCFARIKAFSYKIDDSNIDSLTLNVYNREESLPLYQQVHIDSLIVSGKIN